MGRRADRRGYAGPAAGELGRHQKAAGVAAIDQDYGVYVPAGAERTEAGTVLGDAILRAASDWAIDDYALAEAVN